MATRPITDAERDRVRALHRKGATRNAIAADLGRSPSTVSKIAADLGLSFDRSRTAAATEAKQRDNRARRADIVARLYGRAEHVLDRLAADEYRFTATTVQGIETANLDHVPAQDERHLSGALGGYLSAAERVERIDEGGQAEAARSMLGSLAEALGIPPANVDG